MTEPTPNARPLVTVVIPCFNQGSFLREAIDSVLGQTYRRVEAVVVNDGSTDDTETVATSFGDRIRYLHKPNAGLSAARNTGILHSTGEFMQFLDADDYLLSDTIERFMDVVCREPAGDVYFGSWDVVDRDRRLTRRSSSIVTPGQDMFHRYLRGNVFPCHAALVRRATLANSNLFAPRLRCFEDWDLWMRLAAAGARFVPAADAVVAYRQYPGTMSRNHDRMRAAGTAVLASAPDCQPGCAECRRARREGRRSLRYHLYVNVLRPELRALSTGSGVLAAVKRFIAACGADRSIATLVARMALRAVVGSSLRRLGLRKVPHISDPRSARTAEGSP